MEKQVFGKYLFIYHRGNDGIYGLWMMVWWFNTIMEKHGGGGRGEEKEKKKDYFLYLSISLPDVLASQNPF